MSTFSSPDQVKDHKQYVPFLKKALTVVKPDTEKKFLYFHDYPFGAKKLPLVLVDFDAAFPAVLAKAGHKPTAEGVVALTANNELDFQAKKGSLKRPKLKKYFATLGAGIKPVFVPVGEVDDEDAKDAGKGLETDENQRHRAEVLARIEQVQSKTFPPKVEALKNPIIDKAKSLAELNRFADADGLLDQLLAKAAAPAATAASVAGATVAPEAAKDGEASGDFEKEWKAATGQWETANQAVSAQLIELQKALKKSGDKELMDIAENGMEDLTAGFKSRLEESMGQVRGLEGNALRRASGKVRIIITGFRAHLGSDVTVKACDKNPFKIPVAMQSTLGAALEKLDKALALTTAE